ncbi:MAG: DinB/UmuC family translesion DNA polymerase [Sulfitobacter sp.]
MPFRTLFFDMNSYFASVMQAEEPELRGKPVGVVTTLSAGAACIAASIEAKRCGVGMGVRIAEARRLCPGITFRAAAHDVFVAYHHRIRAAVERVIPIHMAHSVDEFSCHLLGAQRNLDTALQIGEDLQNSILTRVSPALRCSVGVAPNKLLAKIAAELEKPAGLNWLNTDVLPGRIAHLPLRDLPGISKGIQARLDRAGIQNVADLYAITPKQARQIWRSVEGERFLTQLQGGVVDYPQTRRSSLGHGQMLVPANRSPEAARLVARRLLVKSASRLRREGYVARALSVSFKSADHGRKSHGGEIKATQDTFVLLEVFDRYWKALQVVNPLSVSIMLGGLRPVAQQSEDLFDMQETLDVEAVQARLKLCRSIDRLNQRFGQDTIRFGELPPYKVPFTGAKIAFARVPDVQEFHE